MSKPIFDFTDRDCAFQTSDKMAMDTHGNLTVKMSDNMALDLKTGELHITSSWKNDEDDD